MTPVVKIMILLCLLLLGAYAKHVAERQVAAHREKTKEEVFYKRGLAEKDFAFVSMVMQGDSGERLHNRTLASGSLVVKEGEILGAGVNTRYISTDPATHAAVIAVKAAMKHLDGSSLKGCILYAGIKPCPLCLSLLYMNEVDEIIYYSDTDSTNISMEELINKKVYSALIKVPSQRTISERVVTRSDFQ